MQREVASDNLLVSVVNTITPKTYLQKLDSIQDMEQLKLSIQDIQEEIKKNLTQDAKSLSTMRSKIHALTRQVQNAQNFNKLQTYLRDTNVILRESQKIYTQLDEYSNSLKEYLAHSQELKDTSQEDLQENIEALLRTQLDPQTLAYSMSYDLMTRIVAQRYKRYIQISSMFFDALHKTVKLNHAALKDTSKYLLLIDELDASVGAGNVPLYNIHINSLEEFLGLDMPSITITISGGNENGYQIQGNVMLVYEEVGNVFERPQVDGTLDIHGLPLLINDSTLHTFKIEKLQARYTNRISIRLDTNGEGVFKSDLSIKDISFTSLQDQMGVLLASQLNELSNTLHPIQIKTEALVSHNTITKSFLTAPFFHDNSISYSTEPYFKSLVSIIEGEVLQLTKKLKTELLEQLNTSLQGETERLSKTITQLSQDITQESLRALELSTDADELYKASTSKSSELIRSFAKEQIEELRQQTGKTVREKLPFN